MIKLFITIFTFLFLISCSENSTSAPSLIINADSEHSEMLFVKAAGMSTKLSASMTVNFDYDFSIGIHEVTEGEFADFKGESIPDSAKNLAVTNVTYYDAVLFANARSKAENYDTAYTYSASTFDGDGNCIGLESLIFNPNVEAYRLPLEAEWILVASKNWDVQNSWNASNSEYTIHDVCTSKESSGADSEDVICDMAGNAVEWVNDWMGIIIDTTITNFAGAQDGGSLGERILKGGSYRNTPDNITLFNREDVYTITSASKAEYVGFRLAFGSIPNAVWINQNGSASTSRISILANSTIIRSKTGTYKVKLAFRNDLTQNLAYISYSNSALSVIEIEDTLDVYHPDISPNGTKVAFCTGLEGVTGKSSLYVRDLNSTGTNLVKLDVENAAIPRWRVNSSGDTTIVFITDAGINSNEADWLAKSTWEVPFSEGKFGTPKKLFDGSFNGGISKDSRLAMSGSRLLRARTAQSGDLFTGTTQDSIWYNGEQACNVSISKDSTKRVLFLDFGSETGKAFVGNNYTVHERILIADSTGKLIQSLGAPKGHTFDHTEWSDGNLAIATLADLKGTHGKIALVDFSDSSVTDLVEGDELWHPCLWVKEHVSLGDDLLLDLDSAGVYLTSSHVELQAKYRLKMELYWKNIGKTNVICFGSSRMEMGLDPDLYPEWNMLNFAVAGIDASREFYFIRNYALNHSDSLFAITFSVDLDNWRGVEKYLELIYLAGPGYRYDLNHGFWADGIPENFAELVANSYPAETELVEQFTERGGLHLQPGSWTAQPIEVLNDSIFTEAERIYLDNRLLELDTIAQICAAKKIHLIGIVFPQAPQYKSTGSFGRYGLQRSEAKKRLSYLDSLSMENKYFHIMDENKMGDHDYTDNMAYNQDHLSYIGAAQLTSRLDSLLKTLK